MGIRVPEVVNILLFSTRCTFQQLLRHFRIRRQTGPSNGLLSFVYDKKKSQGRFYVVESVL
jgi:hypothetical protein